jgi:hypothetical protein
MVTSAAMQRPRIRSDSFSPFPSPFKMLDLVAMMWLVCRKRRGATMARLWRAQG